MKNIYMLLIILLFMVSCNNEQAKRALINLDKYQNSDMSLPLSSVFKDVKYVRLQVSDNSLIGRQIGKIKKHKDQYYISCDQRLLLIFDKSGNFVRRIEKLGGGPGEYTTLSDYDISDDGEIIILDFKKLLIYDNNGIFKASIPLKITGFNVKVTNDNYLICASGEDYSVYLVDKEGNIMKNALKINKARSIGRISPFIPFGPDSIIFQSGYSNTLLCYDKNDGNFSETELISENSVITNKEEKELKDKYGYEYFDYLADRNIIGGMSAYNDYLFFTVGNRNNGFKCLLVNSKSRDVKYVITENNEDDISYTNTYSLVNHLEKSNANDCFITYVYMDDLVTGLINNTKWKENERYLSLVNQFKDIENLEDENPVLVEFTIK